jgi:hypothetical protein
MCWAGATVRAHSAFPASLAMDAHTGRPRNPLADMYLLRVQLYRLYRRIAVHTCWILRCCSFNSMVAAVWTRTAPALMDPTLHAPGRVRRFDTNLSPLFQVIESGTGSGSLTTSLARAVSPHGKVQTFEFHAERQEKAAAEVVANGLSGIVECFLRDVERDGFPDRCAGKADGVVLDVPGPWKVRPAPKHCHPIARVNNTSPAHSSVNDVGLDVKGPGMTLPPPSLTTTHKHPHTSGPTCGK